MKDVCKVCNKYCLNLGNHIIEHHISAKQYYDIYLRKPDEGKCIICGKDTHFKTIKIGYIGKYCSHQCHYKDSKDRTKWKENRLNKIKQFEIDNNCTFANDLRNKYGNGWYHTDIVKFIYMDSQTKFVLNTDINKIIEYSNQTHTSISEPEKLIVNEIKSIYNGQIITNNKGIISSKYELDIYLPELNIGIEYNGIRYHSIEMGKPKDRILKKSILAKEKNIRLIHIYEFEDFNTQIQLLKNLILGIDNYDENDFNKNNLIKTIPKPEIVYNQKNMTVYGAGKLY